MVVAYGAPITPEAETRIVAYLMSFRGSEETRASQESQNTAEPRDD
jgi:hypothetical protein